MIIQEKTVEDILEKVSESEAYGEEIRKRFNEGQEDFLAYVEREVYSLISDPEKDLLLFILYVLNECMQLEKGAVQPIVLTDYFDAEEKMWQLYEEGIKKPFKERVTPIFDLVDEEEALAFVEDVLVDAEQEEDEDVHIDEAGKDVIWNVCAAFTYLLTK